MISDLKSLSLAGGYAFAIYADTETNATGWRMNGTYEFNPQNGKVTHGKSFGIISRSATGTSGFEYDLRIWPLYYAPKVMFGENKIRAFIKGALGLHFSHYGGTGNGMMNSIMLGLGIKL